VTKLEIGRMNGNIYAELHKYKHRQPTSVELKESEAYLKKVIDDSLFKIGEYSLQQGCKEVGCVVPSAYQVQLREDARNRADFAAHSMIHTTAVAFGIMYEAMSKKGAVGKKRSKSAAEYEGGRIFFTQRTRAWRLRNGVMKEWLCDGDNVCDSCQDNEDDGPIPVTEDFASGDTCPPMHINCQCLLSLIL
jgi:hypothetical protein